MAEGKPDPGRELAWVTVPKPFAPGTLWLDNMKISESFCVLIYTVVIPSGSHFPQVLSCGVSRMKTKTWASDILTEANGMLFLTTPLLATNYFIVHICLII